MEGISSMDEQGDQQGTRRPDFGRFLDAQLATLELALAEITVGQKRGHWMWFVFPQVFGLGDSPMAQRYAILSLAEARAYLAHCVLGARLETCALRVLSSTGRSAREIFGTPDDLKLCSSMTLFAEVSVPHSVFHQVLERFFDGVPDGKTLAILAAWAKRGADEG